MDTEVLARVRGCPTLPSLPAVAARVLELTRDPAVSIEEVGAVISNDQALAVAVLRTANSSFYGLRRRCTTINSALVLLGQSTVKSLVLGFSLIPAMRFSRDGFDAAAHWRRSLYSGVGARLFAERVAPDIKDEVFLGALLQDIGVIAMYMALGERYAAVVRATGGDHRRLTTVETAELEIGHADVGAMLGAHWRLPDELVVPIKYHERPTAAPSWCAARARCIAAGGLVHDVLTDQDPAPALELLASRASDWFGLDRDAVTGIIAQAGQSTREMASLLALETGPGADVNRLLSLAAERSAAIEPASTPPDFKPGAWDGAGLDGLVRDSQHDPITGTLRRRLFDTVVRSAFDSAAARRGALSVVQVNIDGFRALVTARGMAAADEVLIASAALLRRHFNPIGGVVCRWAEDTFAVAIQGRSQAEILRAASAFRAAIERASLAWTVATDARPLAVTASIGAASFESAFGGFERGEQLVAAALRAVEASRASGGNCVRTFVARKAA
jgi:two-component system cell cycle response regulator